MESGKYSYGLDISLYRTGAMEKRRALEKEAVKHVLQYKMLSPSKRLESLTLIHMSRSLSFSAFCWATFEF